MTLFANDVAAATEYRSKAMEVLGTLMGSVTAHGKTAKKAKAAADKDTILAHSISIAAIAALGLIDAEYGTEGYRNTTTGPAYRKELEEAGFSEAKAKLFWEYGQLALKEPENENGNLTGILEVASKGDGKTVMRFLSKLSIDKEADLKKVVQPVKTSLAAMVHKLTAKLSDNEFEALWEEVTSLREEAAKAAAKPEGNAEAKAEMNNIIAAVQERKAA